MNGISVNHRCHWRSIIIVVCTPISRASKNFAHIVKFRNDTYVSGLRAARKKNTPPYEIDLNNMGGT